MVDHSDYFPAVQCEECNVKFESQDQLERHKANSHVFSSVFSFLDISSEDQNIKSEAGGTGEPSKSTWKENHVHKKRFYCSVCYYRVECCRKYRIKRHIQRKHSEAEVLTIGCSQCDKRFKHLTCDNLGPKEIPTQLIAIKALKVQSQVKTKKSSEEKLGLKQVQLQCHKCAYKASSTQRLEIHVKNIHENIKRYACSLCRHATFFQNNLEKHLKTHKNIAAKICKVGCSLCDSLEEHKICDSLGNFQNIKKKKEFQCEECSFSSGSQAYLNSHIDNIHKKYLRFHCKTCDFKSYYRHHVKEHVIKVHGAGEQDTKQLVGKIGEVQNISWEDSKLSLMAANTLIPKIEYEGHCDKSSKEKCPPKKVKLHDKKKILGIKRKKAKSENKAQLDGKPFSCEECGISTKSLINLKAHIDTVHNGVVRFSCSICDFKSYSRFNVERHQSVEHEKEDQDSVYVIRLDTLGLGPRERSDHHEHFSCNLCEKKSEKAITIRNHQVRIHKNENVQIVELECEKCGWGRGRKMKNKTDDESSLKRNPCFICNIDCGSHSARVSHYRREHPTERIFNCNLCDYGSHVRGNFEKHEKKHEKVIGFRGRKRSKARVLGEDLKKNPCFVCNKEFDSHRDRVLHYSQEHPKDWIFQCGDCQYGSNSLGSVKQHQSTHQQKVKRKTKVECPICNLEFQGIGKKTAHYIKAHPTEKIYNCDLCSYGSNHRRNVDYHLGYIHGVHVDRRKFNVRVKPKCKDINCKDCGKLFQTNRQLMIHYRVEHPDKRIFKCESCDYSSNYLPNMKTHINSTHKQLALNCSECAFSTTWNTTFHQHMRDKHGVFQKARTRGFKSKTTGSLICEECGFQAKTEKQMRKHAH